MTLNFYKDINFSHSEYDMPKYLSIINDLFNPEFIFSWELSNMKYPYDLQIPSTDGFKNIEIKNVKYGTYSVALEQYTDTNKKIRGWTHNLINNNVDLVLFSWKNNDCYALFDAPNLCSWWISNCFNYPLKINEVSKKGNNEWQSSYSYVPIKDIPNEYKIKINTEFMMEVK